VRIIFLPVDERFCTRDYLLLLTKATDLDVITPPKKLLGQKKIPADIAKLHEWLLENVKKDDILILSADMLLHGGLIPSRINLLSLDTVLKRLKILRILKNVGTKIYLTATVTRIPKYNSDEEEPDYWEYFGEEIYRLSLKLAESGMSFESLKTNVPEWIVDDFLWRRKRNFQVLSKIIECVKGGIIDFLNVTLDDNSEGSLSVFEAKLHESKVVELGISDKVSIHPGADESAMALLSKLLCDFFGERPRFSVVYANPETKNLIPPYEGEPLSSSVIKHIKSCGGEYVKEISDGDIILLINNMDNLEFSESAFQPKKPLNEGTYNRMLKYFRNSEKIIGIADVKYANGSDNHLVESIMNENSIDWTKTNYYGWNTAGNTVGTTCAHSVIQFLASKGRIKLIEDSIRKYQAILLLEHWGYQANVRQKLLEELKTKNLSCRTLIPVEKWAEEYCIKKLERYKESLENTFSMSLNIKVYFPWHRPFELGIEEVIK
jgi:hypothetical protein